MYEFNGTAIEIFFTWEGKITCRIGGSDLFDVKLHKFQRFCSLSGKMGFYNYGRNIYQKKHLVYFQSLQKDAVVRLDLRQLSRARETYQGEVVREDVSMFTFSEDDHPVFVLKDGTVTGKFKKSNRGFIEAGGSPGSEHSPKP